MKPNAIFLLLGTSVVTSFATLAACSSNSDPIDAGADASPVLADGSSPAPNDASARSDSALRGDANPEDGGATTKDGGSKDAGTATWGTPALIPRPAVQYFGAFGRYVGLSGDGKTLVVSLDDAQKSLCVYARGPMGWSLSTQLDSLYPNRNPGAVSVSRDGSTIVVGEPAQEGNVVVYSRSGAVWSSVSLASGAAPYLFGHKLSLSPDGNTLIALDSQGDSDFLGATSIYRRVGNGWSAPVLLNRPATFYRVRAAALNADGTFAALLGDDSATSDALGTTEYAAGTWSIPTGVSQGHDSSYVALSDDGSVVATSRAFPGTGATGHLRIYQRSGAVWGAPTTLQQPAGVSQQTPVEQMRMSRNGNTVAVKVSVDAQVYDRTGANTWSGPWLAPRAEASGQSQGDIAVSDDGNTLVVSNNTWGAGRGAVYVYERK